MKERIFKREMLKARTFYESGERAEYWKGYMRGLRQRYHGADFGDPGDHERWLSLIDDDYRRDMGRGYRDGYFGPCDWADPQGAIKIMRAWRGWTVDHLAIFIGGVSPRTIEGWEQGRNVPDAMVKLLTVVYNNG